MARVVSGGVTAFLCFSVALLVILVAGFAHLAVIIGFLFCANAGLGLVIPTTM